MLKCQNLLGQMLTIVTTFHNIEAECSAYFEGEIQISFLKKKWEGGYPLRAMIHSIGVRICSEYILSLSCSENLLSLARILFN